MSRTRLIWRGTIASATVVLSTSLVAGQPVSQVQGWGDNTYGQLNLPGLYRKVACGSDHTVAIRYDGTLVAVGHNLWGCLNVPSGTFIDVAAGENFAVAIRTDGTLVGWGNNDAGQATPPKGVYTQVVAGRKHALALRPDGTAVGWGWNPSGVSTPPSGVFLKLATNDFVSIGLRLDGSVVTWGFPVPGTPPGPFIDVAAGYDPWCAAIRASDLAIVAWGSNSSGQLNVPSGRFVSIAIGINWGVGLREDGQAVVWGFDAGLLTPPPSRRFRGVESGNGFVVGFSCPANCDESTTVPFLNVLDFVCFLNRFASGDTLMNCDGSTVAPLLNVIDFVCFLNAFAAGCP